MAARTPEYARAVARVAGLKRWGADEKEIAEAEQALRACRLETYVAEQVAKFPPLTPAQRERIVALLIPAEEGGAAA
jgi:hypothetical protein